MVKLVANVSVNTQKLTELGLLSDFTDMKLTNRTQKTITAKDKDAGVNFEMDGFGIFYNGKKPYSGIIQSIDVVESKNSEYTLSKLSIPVTNIDHYFSKNLPDLMEKIFSGADTIIGSGYGDVLYGFDKGDTIKGKGGSDQVVGGKGSDTLLGNNGKDTIQGNSGNDSLNGGNGKDELTGGSGFDTFVFNSDLDSSSNVDTITDMTPGGDAIDLALSVFTKLGSKGVLQAKKFKIGSEATDKTDRIIYDDTNGNLYYDPDGSKSTEQIQFAKLDAGLALSNTDFFVV